jgi:hypothetical protein
LLMVNENNEGDGNIILDNRFWSTFFVSYAWP